MSSVPNKQGRFGAYGGRYVPENEEDRAEHTVAGERALDQRRQVSTQGVLLCQ